MSLLRQSFMPNHTPDRLQKSLAIAVAGGVAIAVLSAVFVSLCVVFPREPIRRPFCEDWKVLRDLKLNMSEESELHRYHGAFYLTDQETVDYFWMVVFVPSAFVFFVSVSFLVAGIAVAYAAPQRHPFIMVVENHFCASRRGSVRCLSILNSVFAVVFSLLALFLGSSLLTLENSCSVPLFWSYQIASWGLVFLYGGTSFSLRRKAALILDGSDFTHDYGLEMLETVPVVTPDVERLVNEGFKSWMGSSLSSDEEDEPDDYLEEG